MAATSYTAILPSRLCNSTVSVRESDNEINYIKYVLDTLYTPVSLPLSPLNYHAILHLEYITRINN